MESIKVLATYSGWLATFPDDSSHFAAGLVAKALKKAIKWRSLHDRLQTGQNARAEQNDSESEDGF